MKREILFTSVCLCLFHAKTQEKEKQRNRFNFLYYIGIEKCELESLE